MTTDVSLNQALKSLNIRDDIIDLPLLSRIDFEWTALCRDIWKSDRRTVPESMAGSLIRKAIKNALLYMIGVLKTKYTYLEVNSFI